MDITKELVEILEEYSSKNREGLENIKNGYKLIKVGLGKYKDLIAENFYDLIKSDDTNKVLMDKYGNDLNFIKQTKKDIDLILSSLEQISPENVGNFSDAEIEQNPVEEAYLIQNTNSIISQTLDETPRIELRVTTNGHDCPDCYKTKLVCLIRTNTKFKEFDDDGKYIRTHNVETLHCPVCNGYFIFRDNYLKFANLHNVKNTNLDITYSYCLPKIIEYYDFIVISNITRCLYLEHHIRDMIAKITTIDSEGNLVTEEINANYCQECDRFIILKEDYARLQGIPTCKVIDESVSAKEYHSAYNPENGSIKEDTLFIQRGYNVNCIKNLSSEQRQQILKQIIMHNEKTKAEICSYIDTLISRGEKILSWSNAVERWKEDRKFVEQLELPNLNAGYANSITIR